MQFCNYKISRVSNFYNFVKISDITIIIIFFNIDHLCNTCGFLGCYLFVLWLCVLLCCDYGPHGHMLGYSSCALCSQKTLLGFFDALCVFVFYSLSCDPCIDFCLHVCFVLVMLLIDDTLELLQMPKTHFTFEIHSGRCFEWNPSLVYVGRKVNYLHKIDPDLLSYFEIQDVF